MTEWPSYGLALLFCVLVCGSCYRLAKGLERPLLWILGVGIFARIIFLCSTRPVDQANDWGQHIGVVHVILEKHFFPQAADCFECSHPPLYHWLLTPFIGVFGGSGNAQDWGLQWVTLAIFAVGITAAVKSLALLISDKRLVPWAAALLVFWPRGFPFSVTINNDVGAFSFSALALCAILARRSLTTTLATAAALLTKTSAMILLPVALFYEAWKTRPRPALQNREYKKLVIGMALAVSVVLAYAGYNRALNSNNLVIGNFGAVGEDISLGRDWGNFICFDLGSFVTEPDIGYTRNGKGRECFWNFLLKTSLITEHDVLESLHQKIAIWMAWLLLAVFIIAARGSIIAWRLEREVFVVCGLLLGFSFAAQLAVRWIMPMTATNDFRYIFLSLFSVTAFAAYGMNSWKLRAVNLISRGVCVLFVLSSLFYELVPMRR